MNNLPFLKSDKLPPPLFLVGGVTILLVVLLGGVAGINLAANGSPMLSIPDQIPALPASKVDVPVIFSAGGNSISSLIFSVDYDQTNLSFDPTDANNDGVPDVITFNVPAGFSASAIFDPTDTDGEIDVVIADLALPLAALPDGEVMRIAFDTANVPFTVQAPVNFSVNSPPTSFGSTSGQSVAGTTDNGSVLITSGSSPTSTSTSTNTPTQTATSTQGGNPTATPVTPPAGGLPTLLIPDQIIADPASTVVVPVFFFKNGDNISSVIFSVDYDETYLSFDPTDSDNDGVPDAVTFTIPTGFMASAIFDATDTDGELDIVIGDFGLPFSTLPDGVIAHITLITADVPPVVDAAVNFSALSPASSFGSSSGQSVPGLTDGGSVLIGGTPQQPGPSFNFLPLVWRQPSPTPTNTPTFTPTPSITPTPIMTDTPTPTPTSTSGACSNLIKNGGFEKTGSWVLPATAYSASYSTAQAHNGQRSMRTGILNSGNNVFSYSSTYQVVTIPSNITSADVKFWLYPKSSETILFGLPKDPLNVQIDEASSSSDVQLVLILDPWTDDVLRTLVKMLNDSQTWKKYTFDISEFAGQTIKLYFTTFNNGYDGVSSMYVDDVSLDVCDP